MSADFLDTADALGRWCDTIDDGPIAVDTESDHFHAYRARLCLIQLATADSVALVDPLELDADGLQPLFELFENSKVTKVLHAARNDINELDRDYGVGISNLFDTRTAARFLGYQRNSLDWLLEELLDVEPGKTFSRYDWSKRPIDDRARQYAADDVRHLLRLRNRFVDELHQVGWHRPFRQRCEYVCRSVEFQSSNFDPDDWRNLNGVGNLDGRGRAAARALFRWRHRLCLKINRSPVTIFPNRALLRLAKHRPDSIRDLSDLSGIPDPLVDEHADDLVEVLNEARRADAPPQTASRPDHPPAPPEDERHRYNALRRWRNETADRLDIPSEFVATNDTLSLIAADPPDNIDELSRFAPILQWHLDMLGDEFLEVIRSASE